MQPEQSPACCCCCCCCKKEQLGWAEPGQETPLALLRILGRAQSPSRVQMGGIGKRQRRGGRGQPSCHSPKVCSPEERRPPHFHLPQLLRSPSKPVLKHRLEGKGGPFTDHCGGRAAGSSRWPSPVDGQMLSPFPKREEGQERQCRKPVLVPPTGLLSLPSRSLAGQTKDSLAGSGSRQGAPEVWPPHLLQPRPTLSASRTTGSGEGTGGQQVVLRWLRSPTSLPSLLVLICPSGTASPRKGRRKRPRHPAKLPCPH